MSLMCVILLINSYVLLNHKSSLEVLYFLKQNCRCATVYTFNIVSLQIQDMHDFYSLPLFFSAVLYLLPISFHSLFFFASLPVLPLQYFQDKPEQW